MPNRRSSQIHGLCVVKNEADIIEQTLRAAAEWCDHIYILDNGSTDGTWEKVQALAQELEAVTPFAQDARAFDDSIRGDILRQYLHRARPGDWWCILDADEFYIDNPREFLGSISRRYNAVWVQLYTYLFTDKDLSDYQRNPAAYDDHVPIEQRLRYYVLGEYSELRFFRHSAAFTEMPGPNLPPIYPRRIRMKHFAYRSPKQIQARLDTRREPMQRGEFVHEKRANWVTDGVIVPGPALPDEIPSAWEERIAASADCYFDAGDGSYAEPLAWVPPQGPGLNARLRSRVRAWLRRARDVVRTTR
jgi:hypothetical protein